MTDEQLIEALRERGDQQASEAADSLARDQHGKRAFPGSSAYADYTAARRNATEVLQAGA